jgi:5-methyltetrahydropteroyltriglutamate--homocysteine methyltransferase
LSAAQIDRWKSGGKTPFRAAPPGVVTGPIGPGTLHLKADYELFRDLTRLPKKFTVTSPYMLARTLVDGYYHDVGRLAMALAEVLREQVRGIDAAVLQVDEAHLPGHPEDAKLAADVINVVLEGFSGERAVHLCFGNYGGQTVQQGAYEGLLGFLNALSAQHVVLELARRPRSDLEALRDLRPELRLGIGVIDIKDNEVERPAEVARRIEEAAGRLSPERIGWVHPDCGFWMLPRSVADAKMRALVAGRDLYLGNPTTHV